jgi:peptidoglycan/LPS O-acetylase OafA/YrhL
MDLGRLTTPQRISAVAILVIALAAFLPWASVLGISVTGISGDGVITLVLAIAGGAVLAMTTGLIGKEATPGKRSQITLVVLAALVTLLALIDMTGFAAIGLYLTLFGGIAWVVGAAWQLSLSKEPSTSPPAPTTED